MMYAFDLDSTLTSCETLPYVAKKLSIYEEYASLCQNIKHLSYEQALLKRFSLFQKFEDAQIAKILAEIPIYEKLQTFIQGNRDKSCIITSNLKSYASELTKKFNCNVYASDYVEGTRKIEIISKEKIVAKLKQEDSVCYMGDGENDAAALTAADLSIAASYAKEAHNAAAKAAQLKANTVEEALFFLRKH